MSRLARFNDCVVDVVTDALWASGTDHAVASCPDCGTVLIIRPGHTDHMPPLCAIWGEYLENWTDTILGSERAEP